ncbi:unnamed protein product [Camellia sinensis]
MLSFGLRLGIGGMTSQFAQILQSAFGSQMVPPSVAKRLNLKHVRGMLLYGPLGSGKTLIARSICKFLNAKEPLIVNGPDVLDAFQGESERKIRSLFKAAIEDENKFEIDGLKALNNIFIIGTTNRKELIDEALLREGRIELHVKVDYPDEQGRLQILGIYTRNMRQNFVLDKDVNLHEIACRTDGYSGSTLASLVTRAHSYVVVHTGENGLLHHVKNDFKILFRLRMGTKEMQFSTEVLRTQQEIARLKENTAHFQATVETKLETLHCELLK